jgi:cell division septum initiation protein DivIVA
LFGYNDTAKEIIMKELIQMSVDHLTNVSRELERLAAQKEQVEKEIMRLQKYVEEGAVTVEKYRAESEKIQSADQTVPSSSFTLS